MKAALEKDHRQHIQLSYVDSEGDLIEVEDTNDLLAAYRYGEKDYENRVLKFLIETYFSERNELP